VEKARVAGRKRNRVITVATEHAAVLDTCEWLAEQGIDLTVLPVDRDGRLDLDLLAEELDERVLIVSVMMVNNEIGVTQPVSAISRMAHEVGAIMVCDAVQALGKVELCDGPDLIAVSAHKIHGPKGIGALWMRKGKEPAPFIHGGGQELGMRSGTLSPALCVGFGTAAKLADERQTRDYDHVQRLWAAAMHALGPDWIINGSTAHRYFGNLSIRRDRIDAARLLADLRDIAFSLGSACASGSGRPSHVLRAIGLDYTEARSSIRLGFGRYTTQQDIVAACKQIAAAAKAQEHLVA
jgi:cysteine desulfurase